MRGQGAGMNFGLFKFFITCFSLFFTCHEACAAEISWNGGPINVGSGQELVITNDMPQFSDDVTVKSGGTLVLASDFSITNKLVNSGTINIQGNLDLQSISSASNMGEINIATATGASDVIRVSISEKNFRDLIRNGKVVVGHYGMSAPGELETPCNSNVAVSGDKIEFDSSQFVTDFKSGVSDQIVMGAYGTLRFGDTPTSITGDSLKIGNFNFADAYDTMNDLIASVKNTPEEGKYDITDTGMARIRGHDITLKPAGITVTLKAGILQIGAGRDPNNPQTGLPSVLNIGENGNKTLDIQGGALVLGGGGNEGSTNNQTSVNGNIIIGNNDESSAKPDSAMITKAGNWLINGNLILNKSGYLEVGQSYQSSTDTDNPIMLHSTLTINGNFEISGAYTVDQNTLDVLKNTYGNENAKLEVTDEGLLKLVNAKMIGAQINLASGSENGDAPLARSFREASNIINAPQGAITFASNSIDARINVGQNSLLTLGSNDPQWLLDKVAEYQTKNNKVWGQDITAALAIRNPQTLSPLGGLNVDGNWKIGSDPATANRARFADKSLFVVDAAGVGAQAALTGDGVASSLVVEPGAQLLVTDGKLGDTVIITDKFVSSTIAEDGWNANVSTPLYNAEGELVEPATGTYVVRINDGASPRAAFPMLSSELAAVVALAKINGLDTNSANPGVKFISRAVDNRYIGARDPTQAAATIEGAARIAALGAAPQMTMAANNAAGAAITQRTSFARPNGVLMAVDESGNHIIESQKRFARNFALWIMPLYQSTNGFGMEAGKFSYNFNGALGGVALGGDYTFEDTFRVGLAFNIGGGYAQGSGDLNKTTNNMDFWGVGAYAGWMQNNFGLTADVNYTSSYNRLKQDLPESMQMGDLKSDMRGNAISAGLRAEYKILTDYVDIVPHAGFRYTKLFFDSYNAKSGGKVLHGDRFEQNIWTFPLGVSFSREYAMANNWHVKPLLDLNVTPAAGDIKAKTRVRFNGIGEKAEIETKMMDYITYGGTAGFEIGNDTVTLGVDYNGQFGAESSAHGVYGTLRVEF